MFQCPRKYYLSQIVGIERKSLSIPFAVGKIVETGVSAILRREKDYYKKALDHYKKIKEDAVKLVLTDNEKEDLDEIETYLGGMLHGFVKKYIGFIRKIKKTKSDVKLRLELKYGIFVGEIDNMFVWEDGKLWMEELKTAKELTVYRIEKILHDLQHSAYYYTFHKLHKDHRIFKILYHIIRKPSIRQKKAETLQEYTIRLAKWYEDDAGEDKRFYSEQLEEPKLRELDVYNTLNHVADAISRCKDVDDFWQNFDMCSDKYGKCQFFQICHRESDVTAINVIRAYYRKSADTIAYWKNYGVEQPKGLIQIGRL
jgi:hypothetical protein